MMQEGATLSDGGVPSEGVGTYFYIKGGCTQWGRETHYMGGESRKLGYI